MIKNSDIKVGYRLCRIFPIGTEAVRYATISFIKNDGTFHIEWDKPDHNLLYRKMNWSVRDYYKWIPAP